MRTLPSPVHAPVGDGHSQPHAGFFFDGARYPTLEAACMRAQRMVEEGADLIYIGGESTRPGAIPVSAPEEIGRVIPAVRVLRNLGIPLSVDTYKPEVMRAALDAGADLINDVQ